MITDMGNNRVCIFKKYIVSKEGGIITLDLDFYERIQTTLQPLSITVSDFTGRVYVLDGEFNAQKFIYEPEYVTNNNSNITYVKVMK